MLPKTSRFKTIINFRARSAISLFDGPFRRAVGSKAPDHEEVSQDLIRRLMTEERKNFEPYLGEGERYEKHMQFIMNEKKEWVPKGRGVEKSFLFDIVSNVFDVGKFDYLLRDSLNINSGVAIALDKISISRIISHSKVLTTEDGARRICYAKKVADNLQQIGVARQRLHEIVYQHKTTAAVQHMVVDAMVLASPHLKYLGDDAKEYDLSMVTENMGAFVRTSDYVLQEIAQSAKPEFADARRLLEDVERRKNHKRIDEVLYDPAKVDSELVESTIREKLGGVYDTKRIVLLTRDMNRGRKDKEPMSEVLLFDHNDQLVEMKPKKADSEWLRLKSSSAKVLETGIYVDRDYNAEEEEKIKGAFDAQELGLRGTAQEE